MNTPKQFCEAMQTERKRQNLIHGEHNKTNTLFEWATILGEEYGEVCKAIQENQGSNLKEELIQVAAVCQAIYEKLP